MKEPLNYSVDLFDRGVKLADKLQLVQISKRISLCISVIPFIFMQIIHFCDTQSVILPYLCRSNY